MIKNVKSILRLLLCIVLPTQGLTAQFGLQDIPKPDLKEELAAFSIVDGFEVSLYAATPMMEKPTQINFDNKGRLWICSSHIYPQLNVNEEPSDRIVILEDTDKDGVADKSSIFYDKLIIPGGVLPDNQGGAYVANGDKLIHLSDTDGDGKADKSEVLLTGFGTEDTHHTLHRLGWGPGGKIYMQQGYYISSHIETAYGPRNLNGGGLWTYDIHTRRLEIMTKGYVNPWGHTIGYWGQLFESDGAGTGFGHSFPNSVFMASPGESDYLPSLTPKSPKASGIEIISGKHFPLSWKGNVITNDFRAHITDRYSLEADGSTYKAVLEPTFLKSAHKSFRPVDLTMGPDGALYVADWYSPIIQHGEVDFRDRRRDHVHGRIWRITAKGRPLLQKPYYNKLNIPQLLDLLKADENWVRLLAKQTLKTRKVGQLIPAMDKWLRNLNPKDPGYDHHRLEALWTVQTLNLMDIDLLKSVLKSKTAAARSAAVRVLYHWNKNVPDALELLEAAVQDPDAGVRREAITALGKFGSVEAFNTALLAFNPHMDASYSFALRQTCRMLSKYWLPLIYKDQLKSQADDAALIFALKTTKDPKTIQLLIELFQNGKNPDASILTLIGESGKPGQLNYLTEIASSKGHLFTREAAHGLLLAVRDRNVSPTKNMDEVLKNLFTIDDAYIQEMACSLVGYWKKKEYIHLLKEKLLTPTTSHTVQESAAQALAMFNSEDLGKFFVQIIKDDTAIGTTKVAVAGLVQVDLEEGIETISNLLGEDLDKKTIDYLIKTIIKEKGAFKALSLALDGKNIPSENALQASRFVQTSGREGAAVLMAALAKAASMETAAYESNSDRIVQNLEVKLKDGNPIKGKEIYLRPEMACISCHKLKGVGSSDVGPDLGSIGASAPVDYILESLIEPSKKIKEGYKSTTITTKNGDFYSGSIVYEDADILKMKVATGAEFSIQKRSIELRETSKVSMMPAGLTDSLNEGEFIDLLKYLSELGKSQ